MGGITETSKERDGRVALIQVLVLVVLCSLAFVPEIQTMVRYVFRDIESGHGIAAIALIPLLFWRRRQLMREQVGKGSLVGIALIVFGLAVFTVSSWPFNYGYPRWLAFGPTMAGCVLAVVGWRAFRTGLPLVLLLLIAIPMGSRYYAFLIIKPETYTIAVASECFNMLPGVLVELDGPDFTYHRGDVTGSIALGEPHRGASLFMSYLLIGVFVVFYNVRPAWQIVTAALATIPILLVTNLYRLLVFGLVTIYAEADPLSPAPRFVSTLTSLVFAYLMYALLMGMLGSIIDDDASSDEPEAVPA